MFPTYLKAGTKRFGANLKPKGSCGLAMRSGAILGRIECEHRAWFIPILLISLAGFPTASLSEDSGSKGSSTPLTGGISAYATGESSAPLMQGKACDSLPPQWQGTWQGTLGRNDQRLNRETPTLDVRTQKLSAEGAKVSVKLVTTTVGSNVAELEVVDNRRAREGDPNPDIIFFHNGNNGRLLFLPGARMHTRTQNSDVYIGGSPNSTTMIGDNVRIGSASSDAAAAQPQISYNNAHGGIRIVGPTVFNDRYFKADELFGVNATTQINAGRVDIGPAKMLPGGQPLDVTGNADNGFRISRPHDGSQSTAPPSTITSLPYDMLKDAHPVQTTTVMVAAGVFDQRSLSPVRNAEGTIIGYHEMVARYTALSPDKMLVEIVVKSPGENTTPELLMRGYLQKSLP